MWIVGTREKEEEKMIKVIKMIKDDKEKQTNVDTIFKRE